MAEFPLLWYNFEDTVTGKMYEEKFIFLCSTLYSFIQGGR